MGLLCGVRLEDGVDVLLHVLCYYCVILEEALQREVECFFEQFFLEVGVAFDEKGFFADVRYIVWRCGCEGDVFCSCVFCEEFYFFNGMF